MDKKQYGKEYYRKNKSQLALKHGGKIHCEKCNVDVSKWNYQKHCKTKKHMSDVIPTSKEEMQTTKLMLEQIQQELQSLKGELRKNQI